MRIVAEHLEAKHRGARWWVLAPVLVLLVPATIFVLSCFQPVTCTLGRSELTVAYLPPNVVPPVMVVADLPSDERLPLYSVDGECHVSLPWGGRWGIASLSPLRPNLR
jgi:hypothetical protein